MYADEITGIRPAVRDGSGISGAKREEFKMKTRKAGIIGLGHVGAHVLSALVTQAIADEIVLIDINRAKAECECRDIRDSIVYMPHRVRVTVGDYPDLKDCDIVVNASGDILSLARSHDRVKEMEFTVPVAKGFLPKVKASGFNGIFLNISNPCDIVTAEIAKGLGLPKGHVFGTGTGLDSARLIAHLAETTGVDHKSITAYMIGEHGNAQFAPWSVVSFGANKLSELAEKDERFRFDHEEMVQDVIEGAWTVFNGKNCTEYAIAATAARIIRAVLHDEKVILPVSAPLEGEYGVTDTFAGVPAVIGKDGCEEVVELPLTEEEKKHFQECCDGIRENIRIADSL